MIKNSRTRKLKRRKIALENKISQLEILKKSGIWKDNTKIKDLAPEIRKQKILKAEEEIKLLQKRV
jgi:hypothetical protein